LPAALALLPQAGVAAIASGVVLGWTLGIYRRESRARAVERFARAHGLSFDRSDPGFPRAGFGAFAAGGGTFENVVSGRWAGVPVMLADHRARRRISVATAEVGAHAGEPRSASLPDEWAAETSEGLVLVHGPLARPEDLGLVLDIALAAAGHRPS
jgi:hypothetical protein